MWLLLNDAFLSIVHKLPAREGSLLVRARRPGDIEKVFGRRTKVTRATDADYLYRAVVPRDDVIEAMRREVLRVDYSNFKDSVTDRELHDAYMRCWTAMAQVQDPRPYSEPFQPKYNVAAQVKKLGADSLLPPTKGNKKKGKTK